MKTKQGTDYYHVVYPKFKLGEEMVRKIPVPATYAYVQEIKDTLFNTASETLAATFKKHEKDVPEPLCSKFDDRLSREEAIAKLQTKESTNAMLVPAVEEQERLLEEQHQQDAARAVQAQKKQPRKCRKCGRLMKGHPRGHCPEDN
eukprot:Seg5830.3 transcript_id=Seg5830.3/GoldUCD/mRNA.D3Y31 product="hypothetical protein" protein_id=Seg5830.3/GoldUCD/D3Y31